MHASTVNEITGPRRTVRSAVCVVLAIGAIASASPAVPVAADGGTTAYRPLAPCRLMDTRQSPGKPDPGWTTTLAVRGRCGVAADATAVAVTVTVTQADGAGFVTAWPSGVGMPTASSNNYASDETRANGATLSLGADGNLALFTSQGVHVIVDVSGEFYPTSSATSGRYFPLTPFRHIDTRTTATPLSPNGTRNIPLPANVPADATAMAVMLTITDAPTAGFVTAYPAGTDQPFTSALNTDKAHQIRTATQIVPVTAQGMNVFSVAGGNIIIDVVGYFSGVSAGAGSTGLFVPATPTRILDTRNGNEIYPGGAMLAATSGVTGVNAQAVAANVTVTQSGPAGWVTAWAAMTAQPATPAVSYGNRGMTVANLNLISVSSSGITVASTSGTHAIVDITGWFTGTPVATTTGPPTNSGPAYVQPIGGPVGCLQYVPAPSADGVYQVFPNRHQTVAHISTAGPKGPIAVVGDSLTYGSAAQTARALRSNGWGPICVDGTSSRTVKFGTSSIPDGLDAAYRIRVSSPVWNNPAITWVVALGTNDVGFSAGNAARSDQYVAEMRAAIGPNPTSWLNVRTGRGDWQHQEAMFNQSIARSGAAAIDWYNKMSSSWLAGDRVHLSAAGYQARADMLAGSVPG